MKPAAAASFRNIRTVQGKLSWVHTTMLSGPSLDIMRHVHNVESGFVGLENIQHLLGCVGKE
jgi:hypothetical protein